MGARAESLRDLRGGEGVDQAKIVRQNAGLITGNRWKHKVVMDLALAGLVVYGGIMRFCVQR